MSTEVPGATKTRDIGVRRTRRVFVLLKAQGPFRSRAIVASLRIASPSWKKKPRVFHSECVGPRRNVYARKNLPLFFFWQGPLCADITRQKYCDWLAH